MELIAEVINFVLHVDTYLESIILEYGAWTLAILFVIVFLETGFVVTPFLPGDSLIFAAATFAARPSSTLDPWLLFFLLSIAAVLGDTVNYWIGYRIGAKAYTGEVKWIKKQYMERTHVFFEKHGGRTIFLARFVPIIRTFAPFVAGVSRMPYGFFIRWNIIGGITWVAVFTLLGVFFGNIPFVQKHFELVIIVIIVLSVIPVIIEAVKAHREFRQEKSKD
ncbi:MAG: membrane-associated protein [Candidatus Electronema aureum]|uniref:Membrane-associated protein n=1 Tax=Candidatus Electronema aureum TaxID=2005002 RepID=A0A521G5B3_9BACT|nr:MAG: membrane-associated protein [Candidatus Electronema aureum]